MVIYFKMQPLLEKKSNKTYLVFLLSEELAILFIFSTAASITAQTISYVGTFCCKTKRNWYVTFYQNRVRWHHEIVLLLVSLVHYLSRDMTKPTKWLCSQRKLRSAWASAQSDQSLHCPHEENLGAELPIERTAKTLIRLGGCPGCSESSLGSHSFCWFCHVAAHLRIQL